MLLKMINRDLKMIMLIGISITLSGSLICLLLSPVCAAVSALAGAVSTAVFFAYTQKRYKKISDLNDYLSLVCSGRFDLNVADNSEGELSILNNNIYKVITILKSQNEELKNDKILLSRSLADISHQLKTPLTSMFVMTDLIKTESDAEKINEFASVLEGRLNKMQWLIKNLLKLSRLDADVIDFKSEDFSALDAVNESVKPFMIMLDLRNISFNNNMSDFTLKGDFNWCVEAISNIIKNCTEHIEAGGAITVSSQCTNIYDRLVISDNGSGISDEDLPHIFERFYHGKNSSSDSVGIGLALAKSVFEKQNATIEAKSSLNGGTDFIIKFYKAII